MDATSFVISFVESQQAPVQKTYLFNVILDYGTYKNKGSAAKKSPKRRYRYMNYTRNKGD